MKPRIYTDTSAIGECEDGEFQDPFRRLLEAVRRGSMTLVISELTLRETYSSAGTSNALSINLTRIHAYNAVNLKRGYPLLEIRTPRRSSKMSDPKPGEFDCVKVARDARDRISAEIERMSHEQLVTWLRSHRYSDPLLGRLAAKAAQQADPAGGASHRR